MGGTCATILDFGGWGFACTISDLMGGAALTTTLLLALTGVMRGTLDTAGVVAVTVLNCGTSC